MLRNNSKRGGGTLQPAVSHESVESFQKRQAAVVKYMPYV